MEINNMNFFENVVLKGKYIQLEPLTDAHAFELSEASKDGDLWKLWFCSVPNPENINEYIDAAKNQFKNRESIPFAVREINNGELGRVVGTTRLMKIDEKNKRLEIGFTFYAASKHGTLCNTEAKYLLLKYAFEDLNCIAVEFRTHFLNHRSRRAIEKLGAKQDGILRNHVIMNGVLRDTVVFSIIESEWPTIKYHLNFKLDN